MEQVKKRKNRVKLIWVVILIIVLLWLGNLLLLVVKDNEIRGTFGDMFGFVNSLFSGLALAGIIITLIIQRDEMKIQSEEMKYQRFESTLFNLLSLHQEITKDLNSIDKQGNPITGRKVFRNYYSVHQSSLDKNFNKVFENDVEDELGHYFRNIYRLIKFIDQSVFFTDDIDKTRYRKVKFLRSQLSNYELIWISYWGMTDNGSNLKDYLEKYTLLKNLPSSFKQKMIINQFYKDQAFVIPEKYKDQKA